MIQKIPINEHLDLRWYKGDPTIFVDDKVFIACSFLVADLSRDDPSIEEINSIDELATRKDTNIFEGQHKLYEKYGMTPDEILQAHASNIIAWAENGYDTRLLHSNLSFPLLKELTKAGDEKAKRVLQGEIHDRIKSKFQPTMMAIFETCADIMDPDDVLYLAKNGNWELRHSIGAHGIIMSAFLDSYIWLLDAEESTVKEAALRAIITLDNGLGNRISREQQEKIQNALKKALSILFFRFIIAEQSANPIILASLVDQVSNFGRYEIETQFGLRILRGLLKNPFLSQELFTKVATTIMKMAMSTTGKKYRTSDLLEDAMDSLAKSTKTPVSILKKIARDMPKSISLTVYNRIGKHGDLKGILHLPVKEIAMDIHGKLRLYKNPVLNINTKVPTGEFVYVIYEDTFSHKQFNTRIGYLTFLRVTGLKQIETEREYYDLKGNYRVHSMMGDAAGLDAFAKKNALAPTHWLSNGEYTRAYYKPGDIYFLNVNWPRRVLKYRYE